VTARPRIDTMKPSGPARTRTAPPRLPDKFWTRGNYRGYIAFGSCGVFLMLVPLLVLRAVWALGDGQPAWDAVRQSFRNPIYVVFHAVALVALVWFSLRFFRLFPKTQPPNIGPLPRPSDAFFAATLNGGFALAALLLVLVLWGVFP
jgi:fumarate reductase subunit C